MISSWVQIKRDGKWVLVPKGSDEHLAYIAHRPGPTHYVIPDIEPYRSPLDGSVVGSRSVHKAHLRKHGVIERGNEPIRPRKPPEPKGIAQDLARTYDTLTRGR